MRNALVLLSSLALAAAVQAGSVGTSSSITTATYAVDPSVTLSNLVGQQTFLQDDRTDGGGAIGTTMATTIQSFDGATFVVGAMTSASLFAGTPGFSVYASGIGYEYLFDLTNGSAIDQTVVFSLTFQRNSMGSATEKLYTNSSTFGAYADGFGYGGVEILDLLDDGNSVTTGAATTDLDPNDGVNYGPSFSGIITQTVSHVVPANSTRRFGISASSQSYTDFTPAPVPEPASMGALGLGALALLRRRKA